MWVHPFIFPLHSYQFPILWHPSLIIPERSALVSPDIFAKSSDICQFHFCNIFRIDISQTNLKGSKTDFPSNHAYRIIIQTDKLTLISSIFNVHLFLPTKILLFHFCDRTYDSLNFAFFGIFLYLYRGRTYDSAITMYLKCSLDINFYFIFERTYN